MRENKDLKVDIVGDYLKDRSIALCITGGIAAIETPKIARQLRRYGAAVKAYMTPSAQKFITPLPLEWATEQDVVSALSGRAEHICMEDAVVIAPATLNTINKITQGFADNVVTTLVASALGQGKPVYVAPTMHESLYENPVFQENLEKSKEYGMTIIPPRISEGKAKIPKLDTLVAKIVNDLSRSKVRGKKILVTGGPTPGRIDDVRILSNIFKGRLAVEVAKEAYFRGAEVKLLLGSTGIVVPEYLDVSYHMDYDEYYDNVFSELAQEYDVGVFSAAVADYVPEKFVEGKIPSQGALQNIPLVGTKKVIKEVREKYPELYMVTFKYEGQGITHEDLIGIAKKRINEGYDIVVANRAEEMADGHVAHIIGKQGELYNPQSKKEIASNIIALIK